MWNYLLIFVAIYLVIAGLAALAVVTGTAYYDSDLPTESTMMLAALGGAIWPVALVWVLTDLYMTKIRSFAKKKKEAERTSTAPANTPKVDTPRDKNSRIRN